jgi:hypothetical protein
MNELAGKSTCLAMREHGYQLGRRQGEQSRARPLTVRRGGLSSKERQRERLVLVKEACGGAGGLGHTSCGLRFSALASYLAAASF